MEATENNINASIVVFEYENKKLAAQCSDVIETIFDVHIVPKLEDVITHKIPKEIAIYFDSVEIDIGTIKANEFDNDIALRIKNAFEIALEAKMSLLQNSIINKNIKAADTPFYYLQGALEFYMVNGYFPIWFDAKKSLNHLDKNILDKSNTVLLNLIQNYKDDKIALKRLSSILAQHDDSFRKQTVLQLKSKNKDNINQEHKALDVVKLITLVNSEHSFNSTLFSKNQIIKHIKNPEKRQLLIKELKIKGLHKIFTLFFKNETNSLLDFITSYYNSITSLKIEKQNIELSKSINGLALITLLIFENEKVDRIDFEDYFLLLSASIGIEKSQIKESIGIQKFIDGPFNLNREKINKRLYESETLKKSKKLKSILLKKDERKITKTNKDIHSRYYNHIDKNRVNVIKFYLLNGNLPEGFKELSLNDIKTVFDDLINQKFPFLEDCINSKHTNPNLKMKRLLRLIDNKNRKTVRLYLHHYFEEVYEILEKSINEFQIKLNLATYIKLDFKIFRTEFLLKVLAHLKGEKDSNTVINQIHLNFKEYLPKKIIDSLEYLAILKSQGLLIEKNMGSANHQNDENPIDLLNLQAVGQVHDEIILNEELNPTEDISINTNSFKELDLKNQIQFKLSILRFYAEHSYLPWWSDEKSLHHILKSLEIKSTYSKNLFEEIFIETENKETFLGKLAFVLNPALKKIFNKIIAPYQQLEAKWVDSESKSNQNQALKHKKVPASPDTILNKMDVLNWQDQNFKLLKKSIYFLEDKDVLNTKLLSDPFLKSQLEIYLNLAPYFYFQNITPEKWRKILYSFVLINSNGSQSNQTTNFHNSLFTFLTKEYQNISWHEIFTAVYEKTQTSPISNITNFPLELFKLFKKAKNKKDIITSIEKERSEPIFENNSAEEIMVQNAGLIIFWPFLTRLFEQVNLVENRLFISPSAQNRAIYLLQYLVNNTTNVPEFELVLNKILVGMPISKHLDPIGNLNLEEKKLTASLMNGLIQNWPKVQNSTSTGIQETFIQREGVLSQNKEQYKLVITKKTVDILVASIPWNLSLIKLPWMEKPMHIEWI